jgi:hypothetical protein
MRGSIALQPMAPRSPRTAPDLPQEAGRFSPRKFAKAWDRYLRTHPEMSSAALVDLLRSGCKRLDKKTGEWRPVTGTTIYNWRKGTAGEPGFSDGAHLAKVLGVTMEALAE